MPGPLKISRIRLAVAILIGFSIGIPAGVGSFTFWYGHGFSYLSDDPEVCANCHIMRDQLASWRKSGHHHVATCNACHTPGNIIQKYLTKAENGYHHSLAFTSQAFAEQIHIKPSSLANVETACRSCHAGLTPSHAAPAAAAEAGEPSSTCTRCHPGIGHQ